MFLCKNRKAQAVYYSFSSIDQCIDPVTSFDLEAEKNWPAFRLS
jgi:hypothetical protein